jgi:hypothetical protein
MDKRTKINPDQQRQPFGGHHFPEKTKFGTTTIRSSTFKGVVDLLTDYRIQNGIPLGDPSGEVTLYYAKNWPWMVTVDENQEIIHEDNPYYNEWRAWVQSTWKRGDPKMLHKREAADRWAICEKCPYAEGQSWADTKESQELDKRAFLYRRAEWAPRKLKFCSLHKADIGTLSFLQDAKSYSAKKESEPNYDKCWIK